MGTKEHKENTPDKANIAIITLSDSRTIEEDDSGHLIHKLLTNQNHTIQYHKVLPDNQSRLKQEILSLINKVDIIITNGGTGIAKKDITIDTLKPLYEKELTGFQTLFAQLSYNQIKSAAILSRASAGIIQNTTIFSIPGSSKACKLAIEELIIPEIGHIIKHIKE